MSLTEIEKQIPVVRAKGTNYEIGLAHGTQACERVHVTIENMKRSTKKTVGYDWAACCKIASAFLPAIRSRAPHYLEEIQGIADGAGAAFEDILTINCRTELGSLFGYQHGMNMESVKRITGGCTSVGANHTRTESGTTIYGQTWDYSPDQRDAVIFNITRQENKPSIAWIGDAGLICRMAGLNTKGLGLCVNALFTDGPLNFSGMPLQFAIRYIMDQTSFPDAVQAAVDSRVASNVNFVICGREGEMVSIEFDCEHYGMLYMKNGTICHANTYHHPKMPHAPYQEVQFPTDQIRDYRSQFLMDSFQGKTITAQKLMDLLCDHVNYPYSICSHIEEFSTLASTICDLDRLEMNVSVGTPCSGYYLVKPFDELF